MASRKNFSSSRLKLIIKRQVPTRWGTSYIPSILATPQEAPSISHASILNSKKFGREIHTLSEPERSTCLVALYHPDLAEIHEQKMMSVGPCPHPLVGFPGQTRLDLLPVKGLIDVADRLGYLKILPRLKIENPDDPSNPRRVVFPYIGDFLLYLRNSTGRLFCNNLTVKDTELAFKRPSPNVHNNLTQKEESQVAIARHEIEEVYHADVAIRTIRVAGNQINPHVAANLGQLFGYSRNTLSVCKDLRQEILGKIRIAMDTETPPSVVMQILIARGRVSAHDCRTVLYQAVWNRELRVDLFRPLLIDRPLRPEEKDVLAEYAHWFQE